VSIPEGWLAEPGAPSSCAGLPAPEGGFAAAPAGDFTVQFRVAWRAGAASPETAARACGTEPGALGAASYATAASWWGVPYRAEGAFVAARGGVWHLEAIAPASKMAFALPAFAAWVDAFRP
jgi:hypothetical protein